MKVSIHRFWRILALFAAFSAISIAVPACKTLNLNYNEEYLFCGSNHPTSASFINIKSPEDRRLELSDLQLIDLDTQTDQSQKLSSKGCFVVPPNGRFMLRSLTREWASIFESNDLRGQRELRLSDISQNNVSINCNDSRPTTVSPNFSIDQILLNNVSKDFLEGFKIEYEVRSPRLSSSLRSEVFLSLLNEDSRPFLLSNESNLELRVRVKNLLKNRYVAEKTCPFVIDSTPPLARLATNQESSKLITKIHNDDVLMVRLSDSLSFLSEDPDVKEIRYCQIALDDDFDDIQSAKALKWSGAARSSLCNRDVMRTVAPNISIPIDVKSGVWEMTFEAVDNLGNVSIQNKAKFLFYHKEEIELIKAQSSSKVALAVQEYRSLDAIYAALNAEKMRAQLATKFERDEAESSILAGLASAHYQHIINYSFSDAISGCSEKFEFTNDGKYILCGKGKTNLVIWDVANKRLHREFNIIPNSIEIETNKVAISGDGKIVSTYRGPGQSTIWNLESGQELFPNLNGDKSRDIVALDRNGKVGVYLEDRLTYSIMDLENKKVISQFPTVDFALEKLTFSRNNKFLIIFSSREKTARIVEVNTGKTVSIEHEDSLESGIITPDSKRAITASRDGVLKVSDLESGQLIEKLQLASSSSVQRILLAVDNDRLMTVTDSSHFTYLRIEGLRKIKEFDDKSRDPILQLRIPEDSTIAYTSSSRAPVAAWFYTAGKSERVLRINDNALTSLTFERNGKGFYSAATDGFIKHWDISTWQVDRSIPVGEYAARDLSLSEDEKNLIYLAKNPTVMDSIDGGNVKEFPGHFKGVDSISLSHDKRLLATCSHDFSALIWDVSTQQALHKVTNSWGCKRILFSLDDKIMIVHSGADIFMWDVSSGTLLRTLSKHLGDVVEMGLFIDGKRMYSASSDKTIRIWDIGSGKNIQTIETGEGIMGARLSNDEKNFVVWQPIGEISTWSVESGTRLSTFRDREFSISGITIQPDGQKIFTYDSEGNIQVWDQTVKGLLNKICNSLKPYIEHSLCQ
ncbi:MAG: WD40 repeat domain-containing protein [Proteobacteria bacterium]|nr:MAG: WD40 repeat domain-containing protein [Pseudomonadota bacterium]